jgi:hypothetical protein
MYPEASFPEVAVFPLHLRLQHQKHNCFQRSSDSFQNFQDLQWLMEQFQDLQELFQKLVVLSPCSNIK